MLPRFSSLKPETKEEAVSCLAEVEDGVLLAGGTDLLVRMKRGESHRQVIDIAGIEELRRIFQAGSRIRIGPASTHSRISADPLILALAPGLSGAAGGIGSPQVRNMGTIGGNLSNASPCADSIAPLLIHDAVLTIESARGKRMESLEHFIPAPYQTTLSRREVLSDISIEGLQGYEEGYRRVAKRATWAVSRLGIAWAMRVEDDRFADIRLAIGSCTPQPFRARSVEAFLKGQKRQEAVVEEAVRLSLDEIRRRSGERPSFIYKLPVIRDLLLQILGNGQ